jgi:hypothetical protein
MEFRVIWEIHVHAENPRQAAEQARSLQLDPHLQATLFTVWDCARTIMHRVDLTEPANRLDVATLASARSALRQLQCSTQLKAEWKDLVAVMLVFLDAEDGKMKCH